MGMYEVLIYSLTYSGWRSVRSQFEKVAKLGAQVIFHAYNLQVFDTEKIDLCLCGPDSRAEGKAILSTTVDRLNCRESDWTEETSNWLNSSELAICTHITTPRQHRDTNIHLTHAHIHCC